VELTHIQVHTQHACVARKRFNTTRHVKGMHLNQGKLVASAAAQHCDTAAPLASHLTGPRARWLSSCVITPGAPWMECVSPHESQLGTLSTTHHSPVLTAAATWYTCRQCYSSLICKFPSKLPMKCIRQ
jgi:hypothetical protein